MLKNSKILRVICAIIGLMMLYSIPVFAQEPNMNKYIIGEPESKNLKAVWTRQDRVEFEQDIVVKVDVLINDYSGDARFIGCQVNGTSYPSKFDEVKSTATMYDDGRYIEVKIWAKYGKTQFSRTAKIYP